MPLPSKYSLVAAITLALPPSLRSSATASTSYDVANSCRFNSGDSAKMAKSSSGGTRTKWTFSTWFKRCRTGAVDYIFSSYSGSNYCYVQINGNDNLRFLDYSSGNNCNKITNRKFRDPSAWYHMVVQVDTTDGTAGDRFKLWINGVRETSFGTSADFSAIPLSVTHCLYGLA